MESRLIRSISTILTITIFSVTTCFAQKSGKLNTTMDSVFMTNININYDEDTGQEHRTVMGRDIIVFKDGGHLEENYHYTDIPQHHVGIVKEPAKTTRVYDDLGRLIESKAYFTTGKPWTRDIYTYAESGLTGETKGYYIPENKLSSGSKLTLDKHANIIKTETATGRVDSPFVIKYIYNKRNQIIQEDWHTVGTPVTYIYYHKYDNNGNLIEDRRDFILRANLEKTVVTNYSYSNYDSHNNWLLRNAYGGGKLRGILERRITYHK
jgi:hypothetical protein